MFSLGEYFFVVVVVVKIDILLLQAMDKSFILKVVFYGRLLAFHLKTV